MVTDPKIPPTEEQQMTDYSFQTLDDLALSFSTLKRKHHLHPRTEKRLAYLLRQIYPEQHSIPEPGEIPGGRLDLAFYFKSGLYATFEIFATVSQVPQDLRHLELSDAPARIAILTDPSLDEGRIYDEYFRKKPRCPFPWITLSDILVKERESEAMQQLRELIDDAFAAAKDASALAPTPQLALKMFLHGRVRHYQDSIVLTQASGSLPWSHVFGLALKNMTEESPAKGIIITGKLYCGGGDQLKKSVKFSVPPRNDNWESQVDTLVSEQPAVATFQKLDCMCLYGHPLEWKGFKLTLGEVWSGYLEIHYDVSTIEPQSHSSGVLRIRISH